MRLSEHFTEAELGVDDASTPAFVRNNAYTAALSMERVRALFDLPFDVSARGGYRADSTTDHGKGLALDGTFRGVSMRAVYDALAAERARNRAPLYDQVIFYPYTTGHIHFGFGPRMRGEMLVALQRERNPDGSEREQAYSRDIAAHASAFPGSPVRRGVALLALLLILVGVFFLSTR